MRTPTVLCLLLSLALGPASAQWQVDPTKQRERDVVRKTILEDELAAEAKLLVEAHGELRDPRGRNVAEIAERMDRHRRNLSALTREIGRGESEPAKPLLREPDGGRPDWVISP